MKNSVIGILAVAGLAATASAQINQASIVTSTGTFFIRLITDGTPNAGLLSQVNNTLPDYNPLLGNVGGQSAIGVTLQARFVRSTAGAYYGIAGLFNVNANTPTLIRAIDATGSTTVARGRTGDTVTLANPPGGSTNAFGAYSRPFQLADHTRFATYRLSSVFRPPAPNQNIVNLTGASDNPAGFDLTTNFATANGIVRASTLAGGADDGEIAGTTPQADRGPILPDVDGFGYTNIGMASDLVNNPWFNLYRFIVNPGAGNVLRDILFQLRFQISAFTLEGFSGDNLIYTSQAAGDSATFDNQVRLPSPGAAALFGMGGLLAARRRRAA